MKQEILKRVLEMVVGHGGKDAVARRLRVPVATIADWMRADTQIPEHRLVDLLDALEETLKR
jgi:uncharacterized protein (UPF0248 family)